MYEILQNYLIIIISFFFFICLAKIMDAMPHHTPYRQFTSQFAFCPFRYQLTIAPTEGKKKCDVSAIYI